VSDSDVTDLKRAILASGLSVSQLVHTAWSAAASNRSTDKRGGANGGRLRLEPQASWLVNAGTAGVIAKLDQVRQASGKQITLADMIVLGGCAGVEKAAVDAGIEITVPFTSGRTDATQDKTDVDGMKWLEPRADGFRNWVKPNAKLSPEQLLVDRAYMLEMTAKEMTLVTRQDATAVPQPRSQRQHGTPTHVVRSLNGRLGDGPQVRGKVVRGARRADRRRSPRRAGAMSRRSLAHLAGASSLPAPAAPQELAARRRCGTTSAAPRWRSGVAAP